MPLRCASCKAVPRASLHLPPSSSSRSSRVDGEHPYGTDFPFCSLHSARAVICFNGAQRWHTVVGSELRANTRQAFKLSCRESRKALRRSLVKYKNTKLTSSQLRRDEMRTVQCKDAKSISKDRSRLDCPILVARQEGNVEYRIVRDSFVDFLTARFFLLLHSPDFLLRC